ncbi:hypothetical protein [Streptomyces sp. NPDC046870]|uniref:hypothetical protein n=1 Tax=Streptomyces sp. NPDC046870 TaxID=3155135 RepID=UPI0034537C25
MNITTATGTSARITPRGDIDHDTLPSLRAADALPAHVTDLTGNLQHTPFMDVAGLHLLFGSAAPDGPNRRTTVTGRRRRLRVT